MASTQAAPMDNCSVCGTALTFDRSQTQTYCAPCWTASYLASQRAATSTWLPASMGSWLSMPPKPSEGPAEPEQCPENCQNSEWAEEDESWVRTSTEHHWEFVEDSRAVGAPRVSSSGDVKSNSLKSKLRKAFSPPRWMVR
eukprot:TRINITY_DN112400_c0_g1_i1.p1 TRINITY_DN112400_c0_g1~~TRINITY_DN112400_c0_g1_i1.p1  ORF type:complete len:141 (+),score=22.41 TRINITY_DN112400_c0_g1_i1:173-595(+)